MVVIDDLQWAEPVFVDLVEHVADFSRDAPIFLLCIARTELLDVRPGWGGGKLNATSLLLEPLAAEECAELMDRLVTDAPLDAELRERITSASAGNPLFVEEMLAMVREHGGDGEIAVPPTIHALLQARIDSLDGDVRVVMERGAVEGEVFHRGAVAVLVAGPRAARGRVASRDARAQGADPLDVADVPRGRGLPLPPSPHPRRGVRVAAEGDARRAARALRRLAVRRTTSSSATRSSATTSSRRIATGPSSIRATPRSPALADARVRASRRGGTRRPGPRRLRRRRALLLAPCATSPSRRLTSARSRSRRISRSPFGRRARSRRRPRLLEEATRARRPGDPRAIATVAQAIDVLSDGSSARGAEARARPRRGGARDVLEAADDDDGLALYWWSVGYEYWVALRAAETVAACERGLEHARAPGARSNRMRARWLDPQRHRARADPGGRGARAGRAALDGGARLDRCRRQLRDGLGAAARDAGRRSTEARSSHRPRA